VAASVAWRPGVWPRSIKMTMGLDAPEAADAADAIREAAEEGAAEKQRVENERFRRRAAVCIGVLAMLLAISGLGGGNATKEMINSNIQASDTYAFYQAKNIRQTSTQLAADSLQSVLLTQPDVSDEARAQIQAHIDSYNATVARYESDPSTGEGKQELLQTAQTYVDRRDRAARQDPNFDYAQALYQIAIVLGSVSIVATSRRLLLVALVLGGIATLLMLNGFLLVVELPGGAARNNGYPESTTPWKEGYAALASLVTEFRPSARVSSPAAEQSDACAG